jgi:hypothetical protein
MQVQVGGERNRSTGLVVALEPTSPLTHPQPHRTVSGTNSHWQHGSQRLLRTDNCPQPKEARPHRLTLLRTSNQHLDSSAHGLVRRGRSQLALFPYPLITPFGLRAPRRSSSVVRQVAVWPTQSSLAHVSTKATPSWQPSCSSSASCAPTRPPLPSRSS